MKKYRNLHIFIGGQQICHLVKAKRKVNIPISITLIVMATVALRSFQ